MAVKKTVLLAAQRIEIGALLRDTTLNPQAFRWELAESETTNGAQVTRLEYGRSSHAFFQFDHYRRQHYAVYSWGDGEAREEHFSGSWSNQVLHFARWLSHLDDLRRRTGNSGPPDPTSGATR